MILSMAFESPQAAFIDINGGRVEEMHGIFAGIISTPAAGNAREMIAPVRAPLADLNGRDPATLVAEFADSKKTIADLPNPVAQYKATEEKHKKYSNLGEEEALPA